MKSPRFASGGAAALGVAAVLLGAVALPAGAQVRITRAPGTWVGAPIEEYSRLLQLTGVMPLSARMIRPMEVPESWTPPDSAPWRAPWVARYGEPQPDTSSARVHVTLLDPVSQTSYNSDYPYGMNDGVMWAGRGTSTELTAGARVQYGPVTLQIAPIYTWSENQRFPLGLLQDGTSATAPYGDPWVAGTLDRPQRFGDHKVSRLDAGQSSLTVAYRNAKLGWSNENMWWGPGIENALMMTNNAAGFDHVFLGTRHPADIWIGKLEALYSVGWLVESGYWRFSPDTLPSNRWVNGLSLVFEPKGAPGLYLGASRQFYTYESWNPITPKELWTIVQTLEKKKLSDTVSNPLGNDTRDQLASLWMRWVFPEVGLEIYGEYGRNDHSWDGRDYVLEPDHSRAYVLGIRKVFPLRDGILALRAENTVLSLTTAIDFRTEPSWYAHHMIRQGFSQRGQIIGAGIGPGSDEQTLAADWFTPRGRVGLTLQRRRDNTDSFLRHHDRKDIYDRLRHDVFLEWGPRLTLFAGPVDVDINYMVLYEFNRYTIMNNDIRDHHLELRGQYRIP